MYKIGELSKALKVSVKTLRYYEKEGLLKPSYIDKDSGYRYYDGKNYLRPLELFFYDNLVYQFKKSKNVLIMLLLF